MYHEDFPLLHECSHHAEDVTEEREDGTENGPSVFPCRFKHFRKRFRESPVRCSRNLVSRFPVPPCSCVKPQMFLLYANVSACAPARHSSSGGGEGFQAFQIRQGGQHLCVLSQGYISSAKPVKSAPGLDSTKRGAVTLH